MIEIQAPNRCSGQYLSLPHVFLAGSIEMNTAEHWQDKLKNDLKELNFVALNPRRDDWDNTIEQKASDPRFAEQVNWELNHISEADIVAFYFDPNTKSPITLMELGLLAGYSACDDLQSVLVCCPDGFWRKGNVEIVCGYGNFTLVNTYNEFSSTLARWIKKRAQILPGQYKS